MLDSVVIVLCFLGSCCRGSLRSFSLSVGRYVAIVAVTFEVRIVVNEGN